MRFDDAETHRQSDTRADSCGFGGEIRLEYACAKMLRNAGPVVCDGDADHISKKVETARHTYPTRRKLVLQRLLRIDDQVEQHLLELIGIGEDERNILGKIERHFDAARANSVGGDVERRRHDVVHRHRTPFGWLLSRHGEERSHDARTALRRSTDLERCGLGSRVPLFLEQYCSGHYDGKGIVELMRNAGQQRTQGSKLFTLMQRFALSGQLFRFITLKVSWIQI